MQISATLRYVSVTPTVTVTCWNSIVVVAIEIAIVAAVVVTSGNCYNGGEYWSCDIILDEGESGVGYLRGDCQGFCDSGGED